MKKLAILFLLATVLVGFTFGQVSIKGGFELGNVGEGNDTTLSPNKMNPQLYYYLDAAAATDLGPGQIGVHGTIPVFISFQDKTVAESAYSVNGDDFVIGGFYSLPAGPGTLKISLDQYPGGNTWEPGLSYDGIEAGPATLGLGVWYDFVYTGMDKDGKKDMFGIAYFIDDKYNQDKFGVRVSAGIGPLSLTYKFAYGVGKYAVAPKAGDDPKADIANIVYLDVNYNITDQINAGVELDKTGKDFKGGEYKGFQIKPYGSFAVSDNLGLGLYIAISNINPDKDESGVEDMQITPGLWVKYTF